MESFPRKFVARGGQVLTINIARPEDLQEVSEFLRLHFFFTSPNCYLIKDGPGDDHGLKDYLSGCLKHPVSFTVRDATGRLAAIRMNELEERLDGVVVPSSAKNLALIMSLLGALEADIDLFTKYNTEKILSLAMMAVDKSYGQLGLASTLVELSLEVARANGAGAVKVCAVSEYAAKVAAKHGLETLRAIDYATFEFNGDKPLAYLTDLLSEHPVARLMVRRIP